MTLRTVIVDDEPPARRRLRTLLARETSVVEIGEADDGPSAVRTVESLRPDLLFLDVQMPGADGFDVIAELNRRLGSEAPVVIFVTAYDAYALQAFEAHAVDYLLKPFDRQRLSQAVDRAQTFTKGSGDLAALLTRVAERRPLQRLIVRESGRIYFVRVSEIDWIGAAGHYVTLHVGRETHVVRDTISRLVDALPADRFARIHRGTIVNLERVKQLHPLFHGEYEVVLHDGTRLHATRTYAKALGAA